MKNGDQEEPEVDLFLSSYELLFQDKPGGKRQGWLGMRV
jgi:hypothetical protein